MPTLSVLSWNIRHLRVDKARDHRDYITPVITSANIAFLYECHTKPDEVVGELNLPSGWKSLAPYARDEYLIALWRSSNQGVSITSVTVNEPATHKVKDRAGGHRPPVVFDVQVAGRTYPIVIGAWHAPGPAQGVSPDLAQGIMYCAQAVTLLVGDMNFQATIPDDGDRRSDRIKRKRLEPLKTDGSSTFSADGPTNRESAIDVAMTSADDRPAMQAELLSPTQPTSKSKKRSFEDAFEVTDHVPLMVYIDLDQLPDVAKV